MTQHESSLNDISSSSDSSTVDSILIGPPSLTRFELARVLGARALQLSMGAPALMEIEEGNEEGDPLVIARQELDLGLLPITIRRMLPDRRFQDIPLRWLLAGLKARKADTD